MKWRKASRSNGAGGSCVEAATRQTAVSIRDSKNPTGPTLAVSNRAWQRFTRSLR